MKQEIIVKLSNPFPEWFLERQTPGCKRIWNNCKFFINQDIDECDYWVVFEGLINPETTLCPGKNIIFITGEPPSFKTYSPRFLDQFSVIITCHGNLQHSNIIRTQQGLPWHIGRKFKSQDLSFFDKTYDDLKNCQYFRKDKLVSVISSNKCLTEGQKKRLRFIRTLHRNLGNTLDIFGFGIREIEDKWDAIARYKYHIVIENSFFNDYWSEKLSDAFLGGSYPFYYGCPNLNEYFPRESYTPIDINNFSESLSEIIKTIRENKYEKSIQHILASRNLVLDKYNLFALIADYCNRDNIQATKVYKVIFPENMIDDSPCLELNRYMDTSVIDNSSVLVSVIIPCYNYAEYLPEAVESLLSQTYSNWECIIVNDGSTDQTSQVAKDIINNHNRSNIKLIDKQNSGVIDSRNRGFSESEGRFILFLDADDKIHPDFLGESVPILKEHPNVGFVYTDVQKFGAINELVIHGDFDLKKFLSENQATVTSLFRREIYEQVGGFKNIMQAGWEDWEFWVSAYEIGWLGHRLPKPYLYYRQHRSGSRQQKLHSDRLTLFVHKAIIIYLHSKLYTPQEVQWAKKLLHQYRSDLIPALERISPHSSSSAKMTRTDDPSQDTIETSQKTTEQSLTAIYPVVSEQRPKLSITIPTYNPEPHYFEQTIKSILFQNLPLNVVQIEVVDDASTKVDVESIVREIGQGRISFHGQSQNLGLLSNWNDCLNRARGHWVHLLHQDDLVLPGFYKRLQVGLEHPEVGAAFCRHIHIDQAGQQRLITDIERDTPGILEHWLEQIALTQRIQFASIIVKRNVYEHLGGFNPEAGSAADWEMWKRIAACYPIWYEPQPLACYRLHPSSESSRLIQTGANIADTRKAIEISRAYLPRDKANYLSAKALEHYAQYALREAQKQLQLKNPDAAQAQIKEALNCSQSPQVQSIANHLLKACAPGALPSSLALTNPSAFLNQVSTQLNTYQQNPHNSQALETLQQLRQELAQACLELPPEQLLNPKAHPLAQAHALLRSSILKSEPL